MYQHARGPITIEAKNSEGFNEHNKFYIPSGFSIMTWMINAPDYPWMDQQGNAVPIDINNLKSINGVLRNTEFVTLTLDHSLYYRSFVSGFIDLLNVHNIYLHCPNLGHFNSIGVRGENSIIKKIPVSSGFGYQILDSVV